MSTSAAVSGTTESPCFRRATISPLGGGPRRARESRWLAAPLRVAAQRAAIGSLLVAAAACGGSGGSDGDLESGGAAGSGAGAGAAGASPGGGGPGGVGGAAGTAGAGAASGAAGAAGSSPLQVVAAAFVDENEPLRLLADGDQLDLSRAVQGGHVMYVGAQVRNLDEDVAELRARLRDSETGAIFAEEARVVVMKPVEGEPDLWQPDIRSRSQVAHIPACPNFDKKSVRDLSWVLEVIVTSLDASRSASTQLAVVPSCRQTDPGELNLCECECEPDYVLGKCSQ